jgi:hypothetical protein
MVLQRFSLRLLAGAQDSTFDSSAALESALQARTIKYVSSAYLQMRLPNVLGHRSAAVTPHRLLGQLDNAICDLERS